MTVEGFGQIIRNPGGATPGGSCLATARYIVPFGGTQSLGSTDSQYINWVEEDWDDIGFPGDWATSTLFFNEGMDGDYQINAYCMLEPSSSDAPGEGVALITIVTSMGGVDEQMSAPIPQEIGPKLTVSAIRRFVWGDFFKIGIAQFNGSESRTISAASVSIARLCDTSGGGGGGGG